MKPSTKTPPKPQVFTDNGKVIQCPCSRIKFIPVSFTLRMIAGIKRKCCTLKCAGCGAFTTTTKIDDGTPIITQELNIDQLIQDDKNKITKV